MDINLTYGAVVFLFIVIDYVTGFVKALKLGNWKSAIMKQGLYAKLGELLSIVLMYIMQSALPLINISLGIPFVQALTVYLVIMELGSIIENLGAINPDLANKLTTIFEDFKKGVDE